MTPVPGVPGPPQTAPSRPWGPWGSTPRAATPRPVGYGEWDGMPQAMKSDRDAEADIRLVGQVRDRDEESVQAFLDRFMPLMQHCVTQFEAETLAREDLIQDLSWHVLERLDRDRFDPEKGSLGTWVYRVAWCRCVDLKRRANSRRHLHASSTEDDSPEPVDPIADPSRQATDEEMGRLVRSALMEIEPADRALLILRHMEGLALGEIAAREKLTLEQCKYRIKRANTELRRELSRTCRGIEVVE